MLRRHRPALVAVPAAEVEQCAVMRAWPLRRGAGGLPAVGMSRGRRAPPELGAVVPADPLADVDVVVVMDAVPDLASTGPDPEAVVDVAADVEAVPLAALTPDAVVELPAEMTT